MNTKKLVFAFALALGFSTASFAGTPKGDAKATKSENQIESTVNNESHTYWIIDRDGSGNYNLTKDGPVAECDMVSTDPCQITTEADLDSTLKISESDVTNGNGVQVDAFRTL